MPLFVWTSLCASILMIFAMPPLTVATALLALDRYLGFHFFTNDLGGDMMNYRQSFLAFRSSRSLHTHPAGVWRLFGSRINVLDKGTLWILRRSSGRRWRSRVLSFTVWVHHFFTMGQSADLNAIFGIATMTVGVPTGVKIYDWIWTMFRGEVRFTVPMLYALAFMMTFVLGGFTGILLAFPPLDYLAHNTLFLVAHFHNMLIPACSTACSPAITIGFPRRSASGSTRNGAASPSAAGLSASIWRSCRSMSSAPPAWRGERRRCSNPPSAPWLYVAGLGALVLLCALASLFVQLWVSIKRRDANRVTAGRSVGRTWT